MVIQQSKVAVVTPMWQRPEIFRMFAGGVNALKGANIIPCIAGSEGTTSRQLVKNTLRNARYVEMPNKPLSVKTNAALQLGKDCDYFLCMGSDDIIHPDTFTKMLEFMNLGADYVGLLDFYFYDFKSDKSLYWGGYTEPHRNHYTIGAGRMFSRKFIEAHNYRLWEERDSGRLDTSSQQKINAWKGLKIEFTLKEFDLYALDIKGGVNITPFKKWDNSEYVCTKLIKDKFNYIKNEILI